MSEAELSSDLVVVIETSKAERSKFSVVSETPAARRLTRCTTDKRKSCRSPVKKADIDVDAPHAAMSRVVPNGLQNYVSQE